MIFFRRAASLACVALTFAWANSACSAPEYRLLWESGFEGGFPGEWFPYQNGSWSFEGGMPDGRVSAWTIVSRADGQPVFSGDHAYRGWITGTAGASHRAYPVMQFGDAGPTGLPAVSRFVNSFMVWLDCDYDDMGPGEWIHLGSWANNADWKVHGVAVRDRKIEFAHTDPFHGEYIGPDPMPDFPLRRWVRMTAYVEYAEPWGFVQVWQDGVPMLRARVIVPGTELMRAHWGLYAHPGIGRAVMYDDDIRIWSLSEPLSDLVTEPQPDAPTAAGDVLLPEVLPILEAK